MSGSPEKVWETSADGLVEYQSLQSSQLDNALSLIREAFIPRELIAVACEVDKDPIAIEDVLTLCKLAAEDGLTIVAVEKSSQKLIGVCFNRLEIKPSNGKIGFYENFVKHHTTNKRAKAFIENMIEMDNVIDLFQHFNTDCFIDLMFLTTSETYSGKRIGYGLCQATINLIHAMINGDFVRVPIPLEEANEENPIPKIIVAQFTSAASQKIGDNLGFKVLADISYNDFSFDGVVFSQRFSSKLGQSLRLTYYNLASKL